MIGFQVSIHTSGTLFSARSSRIVDEIADDVEEEVSEYAYDQIQNRLRNVLKHPTGYYQSKVRRHQVGSLWQVDDDNVVYGPWLEDGHHRRRTRFKGYQTFRRVLADVEARATPMAERVVTREIGRLK